MPGQTYTETASDTPLYAELVASWSACAATVPGVPDSEWQRLTSYQSFLCEVESVLRDLRPHRAPDTLCSPTGPSALPMALKQTHDAADGRPHTN